MVINASFIISGQAESLEYVSWALGILPSRIRNRSEFIHPAVAHSEWVLTASSETSLTICELLYELIAHISDKTDVISSLIESDGIQTSFVISVHSESDELPELVLPQNVVNFASSINAEFGFDIYTNDAKGCENPCA